MGPESLTPALGMRLYIKFGTQFIAVTDKSWEANNEL
jgi:hypothetical protein